MNKKKNNKRTKDEFMKFYKQQSGNYVSVVDEIWEFFHSTKTINEILNSDEDD